MVRNTKQSSKVKSGASKTADQVKLVGCGRKRKNGEAVWGQVLGLEQEEKRGKQTKKPESRDLV